MAYVRSRTAKLPAFCLDVMETTVAEYRKCVQAGNCQEPMKKVRFLGHDYYPWMPCNYWQPGHDDHPIACASFDGAKAYCRARGARLPTPAEWQLAAGRNDCQKHPWGDTKIRRGGVCLDRSYEQGTCPVDAVPQDVSPFGVRGMGGNADEWTAARNGRQRIAGGSWVWSSSPIDETFEDGPTSFPTTGVATSGLSKRSWAGLRCATEAAPSSAAPAVDAGTDAGQGVDGEATLAHLCPAGTVFVPGRVSTKCERTPLPAFCIDRLEATNQEFRACAKAGKCSRDSECGQWRAGRDGYPIDCATRAQAAEYCRSRGGRLPTWDEWTRAASGGDGRKDPWGEAKPERGGVCWERTEKQGPCPVGTSSQDVSPFGAYDMGANVQEWTFSAPIGADPRDLYPGFDQVLAGGSWITSRPARDGLVVFGTTERGPRRAPMPGEVFRGGIRCTMASMIEVVPGVSIGGVRLGAWVNELPSGARGSGELDGVRFKLDAEENVADVWIDDVRTFHRIITHKGRVMDRNATVEEFGSVFGECSRVEEIKGGVFYNCAAGVAIGADPARKTLQLRVKPR